MMSPFRRPEFPVLSAVLGILLAGAPVGIEAQVNGGTPPGDASPGVGASDREELFLLIPFGAQGVGLGRAMTALSSREGAFWNPAGLAGESGGHVLFYHGNQVVGDALGFSAVLGRAGRGAVGVSYGLLDIGRDAVTNPEGEEVGSLVTRGHQGIVSGAASFGTRLDLGVNLKFVRFGSSCRGQCPVGPAQASSYAVDLGAMVRPLGARRLALGAMVAHLGPGMKLEDGEDRTPLPTRIRLGVSYELLWEVLEEELGLQLLTEVEDRARSLGEPSLYLGAEARAGTDDQVYLRGGYVFGDENQIDGAAVGLGLRYDRFDFGIARSLAREGPTPDREPVHLTLGVRF